MNVRKSASSRGVSLALGVSFAATGLFSTTTLAQEAAPQSQSANNSLIEEIVVTSRRRSESQQDVPLSVTAFNEEAIEQLKPTTLRDFDGLAPNLYVGMNTAGPGASALFIRGVGYADIEKSQTPQVGVIVDGVQIGSSTGQLIDVFDVESIEVNRGPQGLFFGKNTIGGNIVVNRVRPEFDKFGAKFSVQAGNYHEQILKGRVNIPINDHVAIKVGAIEREREGFYDNLTLGISAGDVNFSSKTISLRIKPDETMDVSLTYDRIDDSSQIPPQDPRFNGDNPFENLADKREPTTYKVNQLSFRADWDINDSLNFNTTIAWHDSFDKVNQDFDGGSISGAAIPFAQLHTLRIQEYDVYTQEHRFSWAANDMIDVMFGMYYFKSDLGFSQRTNNVLQLPPVAIAAPFAGLPCATIAGITGLGLRANPGLGDALCQFPNARSTQFAGEDVESLSFFAAVNFRLSESFEFNLGLRRIDEDKDAFNSYFDFSDNTFDTNPRGTESEHDFRGRAQRIGTAYEVEDSWDDTLFAASAKWSINEDVNTYISYSEGFRSGGFSIRSARDPSEAAFQPENAEQIEIGLKSQWFDRRVRFNVALFELDREGSQFSSIITLPPGSIPGTTTIINNGAGSTIRGWEIETLWVIDENWSLIVNGGTIDVDNKAFSIACELLDGCATGVPGVTDPLGTPRNLGGNSDSRQPDWNANITLAWGAQVGPGYLSANLGWKKVGDFLLVNTGGGADQRLFEGGYTSIDARVGYEWQIRNGDTLSVSIFGKNLGDEEWKEQALFLGGPNTGFQGWGAPATYAIELSYDH
ncbi:MAG: TonB-dependent receptor [Pseudomonadota bacterium]